MRIITKHVFRIFRARAITNFIQQFLSLPDAPKTMPTNKRIRILTFILNQTLPENIF